MNRYVIYTNDNGTDAYLLGDSDTPEDEYMRLLDLHGDNYFITTATYVVVENNKIIVCYEIFIPEFEEE